MKTLIRSLILLTCLLFVCLPARGGVTLEIPVKDSMGRNLESQVIVSNTMTPQAVGTNVIGGLVFKRTATNGMVTLTNMVPSAYSITLHPLNQAFTIAFTNETGTVNAADARYRNLKVFNWTNATDITASVLPGTNVVFQTNTVGGVKRLTVNATGSGGGGGASATNFASLTVTNTATVQGTLQIGAGANTNRVLLSGATNAGVNGWYGWNGVYPAYYTNETSGYYIISGGGESQWAIEDGPVFYLSVDLLTWTVSGPATPAPVGQFATASLNITNANGLTEFKENDFSILQLSTNGAAFRVPISGDRLILGTGSNAVTLTVTNGDTISLPMKWLVDEVEASAVTVNGDRITSWQSIFSTNNYSGLINTPILALITTNGVVMSGTNRLILGTVPTFTSATISGYTNVFTAGSIPPLPDYRIEVSTNGGADWFTTQESVLVTNMVSFYDANGASSGGGGGNIVIYGYATADYIGNTVDLAGQTIYVDDPTNSRAAANLNTAQAQATLAAALWGTHTATAKPNLAGFGLNLDRTWTINHASVSNETRIHLGPYGESLLSFAANHVPATGFGSIVITNTTFTPTNLTLLVDSRNVVAALIPQFVTNVTATNWADVASYTTTWPLATNGLFTLVIPTTSNTFYRVRMATNATYTAMRRLTTSGSFAATNGVIHPSLSAAPTLTQIGATNVWFTWASNGTPPLLVSSYYNADSNIVSKTLAP